MRKDKGEEFFSRGATVLPSHFPELPACHSCRSRRCVTCGVGIVGGALFGYEEACVQETDSLEGVIYEPGVFQFFFPEVTGGSVTIVVGCIYARLVGALVSGLCVCVRVCNCVFDAFFFCLYSFFFCVARFRLSLSVLTIAVCPSAWQNCSERLSIPQFTGCVHRCTCVPESDEPIYFAD